ncbi:MAG: sulfurtransferase complex subunit TusB [Pseudomonadota bacterium]
MASTITISSSLHDSVWLYEALGFASENDTIVLIEDAAYGVQSPILLNSFVAKCQAMNVSVYVLREDIVSRGVEVVNTAIEILDLPEFVTTIMQSDKHVAW